MNKKLKNWLVSIGLSLLVLLSLALIFNRQIKTWMVAQYNPTINEKVVATNSKKKGSFDYSKVKSLDWQTVLKARASENRIKVIGEIAYPDVDIHLPIGKGVDNLTLALAAGTLKADQKMGEGNYALAGHHMVDKQVLFSPLYWKAKIGQKVYLTDETNIYEYQVNVRQFIKATDVQVVDDVKDQKLLTLVTCDDTGEGRLMIRAKFVKKMAHSQAPQSVQKLFANKFNR
ncbi:class A sortase [Pediococcus stilesii]|uniref:Sortase (Surface protein transpeptidase) n=1 Tax=Pediococcus stilesii TaxID=331679 RepID=A0A0R2L599_9LACO|nr:class A sortase [Pediococcus stilesii]KRN93748.1 sortase (surface protein transpeptidase) [Pediococcus stilesii]